MRKLNAIITVLIMLLFLAHGILGAFQLTGVGNTAVKPLAWAAVVLMAFHTMIGIRLTAESLRVWKRTGAPYFRENALFWARRISGFAILVLMVFHITAFGHQTELGYRLRVFNMMRLTAQILLTASLSLHILTNIRPLLISFGVRSLKKRIGEILIVLSVILLFMTAALIVYYLRWHLQ